MHNRRGLTITLAAALITLAPQPVQADGAPPIEWVTEYGAARHRGTELQRPVLLFVTMDGCSHCLRMRQTAFQDSDVVDDLQRHFVPAMLELNPQSELARKLRVTIYPTTVIISTQGKILDYARGYLTTDELRQRMASAIRRENSLASSH
jgi:thioredoxin-related protein